MTINRRDFLSAVAASMTAWGKADLGEDVFFASVTDLNARWRKKEFSSVELTRAFCDRLERIGPRYRALSLSLRDDAIQTAQEADADLRRERLRGPLQGIPFGAKDLLSVAGKVTTWGAKPYEKRVFDYTATVLTRLAKVKAPLAGKLAMVELAGGPNYGGPGASVTGACLNPWNTNHWAGGSSSGSGAAVAAGLVPWAIGTETSGSILTPAAFCGLTGLRPTYGLVSRYGGMELSASLDKIGPMCRAAVDCGHALAVMAGGDPKDPTSAGKSFYYAPQFARPLGQITVGYAPVDFESWAEEAIRPALREGLAAVRALGVKLVEKKLPALPASVVGQLIQGEAAFNFRQLIESGQVDQLADTQQIEALKKSLSLSAADYLKAKQQQLEIRQAFEKLFFEVDVLLCPARLGVANKNEPFARGNNSRASEDRGNTGIIPLSNVAGVPAICFPCGLAHGLPVGLQLVSRWFNENMLISIAAEFQRRTDWHKQRPPVSV